MERMALRPLADYQSYFPIISGPDYKIGYRSGVMSFFDRQIHKLLENTQSRAHFQQLVIQGP